MIFLELMTLIYFGDFPDMRDLMLISIEIGSWDVRDLTSSRGPSPWQPCHGRTRPRWSMYPAPVATGAPPCTRSMAMEAAWGPKIWKSSAGE